MWVPNGQSGGATYLRDPITGATGIADQYGNVSTDGGRTYASNLGMPLQQFMMAGSNEAALRQSGTPAMVSNGAAGGMQQGGPAMMQQGGAGNAMVGQAPQQGAGAPFNDAMQGLVGVQRGVPAMVHQGPIAGYPQMPGYPQADPRVGFGNEMMYGGGQRQQGGPYMAYGGNPGTGQTQYGGNAAMYGAAPGQQPWSGVAQWQAAGGQMPPPGHTMEGRQNISVPLANQMNPGVWDSLSPMGRQLAYGAIGQTGQDPGEYENALNKARPQGQAPRTTTTRYAPQQNYYTGGY